jgi:Cdc6-like AAA superfamily ATPase
MAENKDKWDIDDVPSHKDKNELITNKIDEVRPSINISNPASVQEVLTSDLQQNVVLFVGPREVGKTVTLMRLIHYLNKSSKVSVSANKVFRSDNIYKSSVDNFMNELNQPHFSAKRTNNMDFLVLDVYKDSDVYCQFVEASGEAYFDSENPNQGDLTPYVHNILSNENINKVFVFFFEDGMLAESLQKAYVNRLTTLLKGINRKKDDVIILYNKCDKLPELFDGNKPNVKSFKKRLYNNTNYGDFFGVLSKNNIPIKFLPFSNGNFQAIPNREDDKLQRWTHSSDNYPSELWRLIEKCFKSYGFFGKFF